MITTEFNKNIGSGITRSLPKGMRYNRSKYNKQKKKLTNKTQLMLEKNYKKVIYSFEDVKNDLSILDKFEHSSSYYACDTESTTLLGSDIHEQHSYSVQLMNPDCKFAIFLKNPTEFIEFVTLYMDHIAKRYKLYTKKGIELFNKAAKLNIFCHNLKWDSSFFTPILDDAGFTFNKADIYYESPHDKKKPRLKRNKKTKGTYDIVEADGVQYSLKITLGEYGRYTTKKDGDIVALPSINFLDSVKITNRSLADIGKDILKLPSRFLKVDGYDYESHRPYGYELTDFEKEYCYNDVFILAMWVKYFFLDICMTTDQYGNPKPKGYTSSSIAYKEMIDSLHKGFNVEDNFAYINPSSLPGIDIARSYKGGLAMSNRNYELNVVHMPRKIYGTSIDYNSHYPSCYYNNEMPVGIPILSRDPYQEIEGKRQLLTIAFDGVAPKKHNRSIPITQFNIGSKNVTEFMKHLGKHINGNSMVHTNIFNGECIGTNRSIEHDGYDCLVVNNRGLEIIPVTNKYVISLWDFEYKLLLENFDLYTVNWVEDKSLGCKMNEGLIKNHVFMRSWIFDTVKGIFKDFTEKFMFMKASNKGINPALENYAKMILNGMYGKHGTNPIKRVRNYVRDSEGYFHWEQLDKELNFGIYEDKSVYYKPIASITTAHGRVKLIQDIIKVGHMNWYYTDTDSIYTTLTIEELREIFGDELHPTELGKLDIENVYTHFKTLAPKKYAYIGCSAKQVHNINSSAKLKIKCAGANINCLIGQINANGENIEDFSLGYTIKHNKTKVQRIGGYQIITRPYTIDAFSR